MQKEIFDVAIVGFGFAGKLHREALRGDPRINRLMILDIDWDKRDQATAEGLAAFYDLNQLLDEKPDVIITALPPAENLKNIKTILNHDPRPGGLLIEKPLATTLPDAEEIARLLSSSEMLSMVGLTGHGYHPEFKRAAELIRQGHLGQIHTILENVHLGGPGLPQHYLEKAYGGVVIENGIHTIDHLLYLTGQEQWQVAHSAMGNDHWGKECPDWGVATLTTEATLTTIEHHAHASWLWPKEFQTELEDCSVTIIGNKGKLKILAFDGVKLQTSAGSFEEHFHNTTEDLTKRHVLGFEAEDKDFLDAVEKNKQTPISVSYALILHGILHQIEQKAAG